MFFVTMEPNVMTPKRTEYGKAIRKQYETHQISEQRKNISQLEPRTDGICNTLTGVQKDNLLTEPKMVQQVGDRGNGYWSEKETAFTIAANSMSDRQQLVKEPKCEVEPTIKTRPHGYYKGGEYSNCPTVKSSAMADNNFVQTNYRIRKLTERECFRLMDVSESDIDKIQAAKISRSQQYKLAGNSIVVACLEGIFRKLLVDTEISEWKLFY